MLPLLLVVVVSCRRDEDFEHVTLADSDSELESGQSAEFEKVTNIVICTLHSTYRRYNITAPSTVS